jgi:hypothetical protein
MFITEQDRELTGSLVGRDPMGVLAIWSIRGRDLVPHLTEQTTVAAGFQLLLTTLWLWERFVQRRPGRAGAEREFFLVVEQAFARATHRMTEEWWLPGRRRVLAHRGVDSALLSVDDRSWHLLGNQLANGVWGLYRGAARRAGLLLDDHLTVSAHTAEAIEAASGLTPTAVNRLFRLVDGALDGGTVPMSLHHRDQLVRGLAGSLGELPQVELMWQAFVEGHDLTEFFVERYEEMPAAAPLDHREFLSDAMKRRPHDAVILRDVLRCETLLAPVESTFLWLCSRRNQTLEQAGGELPTDLELLRRAHREFADSGAYGDGRGGKRYELYRDELDTSSAASFLGSVVALHDTISRGRGRAPWLWLEGGRLMSEYDTDPPSEMQLQPYAAWRNDYYLEPLRSVARQLQAART